MPNMLPKSLFIESKDKCHEDSVSWIRRMMLALLVPYMKLTLVGESSGQVSPWKRLLVLFIVLLLHIPGSIVFSFLMLL